MYNEDSKKYKELAFPHIELDTYSGKPCNQHYGLTKRELFSAMAMQGLISKGNLYSPESIAKRSVECADALLAELNKGKEATDE